MSATPSLPPAVGPGHTYPAHDRTEYRSERGVAAFWTKDGLWHIALPSPNIVDGLRTGGFLWTGEGFNSKSEAVSALWKNTPAVEAAPRSFDATKHPIDAFHCFSVTGSGRRFLKAQPAAYATIRDACNTHAAHEARIAALVELLSECAKLIEDEYPEGSHNQELARRIRALGGAK